MKYEQRMWQLSQKCMDGWRDHRITQLAVLTAEKLMQWSTHENCFNPPEACILQNVWEQICAETQTQSLSPVHRLLCRERISDVMDEQCCEEELIMLWMGTDSYEDWTICELQDEREQETFFDQNGVPCDFAETPVLDLIEKEVMNLAGFYTNDRIRKFLYL